VNVTWKEFENVTQKLSEEWDLGGNGLLQVRVANLGGFLVLGLGLGERENYIVKPKRRSFGFNQNYDVLVPTELVSYI
jgi:hypothetical protein